ncbi:hypothetical protein QE418_001945 [Microbacterium testaceum]|uniref:DUF2599 domain-containing protein n=1 Tax=Microbacterium TaxID=33882 RepID=UPI002786FA0D|nr:MULTISPECIES: DUF2599 domain-containing protein [Microbacterium]MDQ1112497.1 hypothetical protein [Microbacterium testaceum]MDR6096965.1 hypothetical protein [Microbacterium sp. SORGH_AS_0454]
MGEKKNLTSIRVATVGVAAMAMVASMGMASPATAVDNASANEAVEAVANANPEVFETASRSTADAVATSDTGKVTISTENGDAVIDVTLPEASARASVVNGVAVLDQSDNSAIVPVPQDNGSVAIHSVLNDSSAPDSYAYTFDLNPGDELVSAGEGGGFGIFTADGGIRVLGAAPWAKDANGVEVPTRYELVGNQVVQHVDHHAAEYAYPIVADPYMGNALVQGHRWETSTRILVTPTTYARGWAGNFHWVTVGEAGFSELVSKQIGSQVGRLNNAAKGQYICHVGYAPFKDTWNLETNKADRALQNWVVSGCN